MEPRKNVLSPLLELMEKMALPKEDYADFVRDMLKRFDLSFADCLSKDEAFLLLQDIRGKVDDILLKANDICGKISSCKAAGSENEGKPQPEDKKTSGSRKDVAVSVYPKGYSKNGKKLGRPKKKNTVANAVPPAEEKSSDNGDADKTTDNQVVENANNGADALSTATFAPPVEPEETDADGLTKTEKEELEKAKMGKEYPLDILYQWRNKLVVSNRIMQEGMPLGVFVSYNQKEIGERFVLYLYDEISGLPLKDAQAYARNKLPAFRGEKWKLLDQRQISAAKAVQPELNKLLKKLGGDAFVGSYMVPKTANYHKMPDKIRYALYVRPTAESLTTEQ